MKQDELICKTLKNNFDWSDYFKSKQRGLFVYRLLLKKMFIDRCYNSFLFSFFLYCFIMFTFAGSTWLEMVVVTPPILNLIPTNPSFLSFWREILVKKITSKVALKGAHVLTLFKVYMANCQPWQWKACLPMLATLAT